jgi:hypothetical protein
MAKQDNENNLLKNKKLIKRSKNIERFIYKPERAAYK